ncbi:hypothetical protein [Nocardia salmonicida]
MPDDLLIERGDTALCSLFLTEYLFGPGSDELWIGPGLECLAVGREFAVLLGEQSSGHVDFGVVWWLGVREGCQRLFDPFGREGLCEPPVEGADDVVFSEVDGGGVVDLVGDRVFGGVAAAVVRFVVVPVALHPSAAGFVEDQPFVHVAVFAS